MSPTPESRLLAEAQQVPLYRQPFAPELLAGRIPVVCCEPSEFVAARDYFSLCYALNIEAWGLVQWKAQWQANPNPSYPGIRLIPLGELARNPACLPILYIGAPRERTIGRLFAEYGLHCFCFHKAPQYPLTPAGSDFFEVYGAQLAVFYDLLADDPSRHTLLSVIRHRQTQNDGYLYMAEYPEYRHEQVRALPGEVVFDAGGYDGLTAIDFARQVGPSGRVFCFEPDARNLVKVHANLEKLKGTELESVVDVVPCGLADAQREAELTGEGGSAKVKGSGGMATGSDEVVGTIALTSIDQFVAERGLERVDLLKFDIEGMEQAALDGGVETLRRFRPKLQVSAYHKVGDIVDLPLWLHGLQLGYRFYLGHHDTFITETDLYAVAE